MPSFSLKRVLRLVKLTQPYSLVNSELFVCQIYVDDSIFCSTNPYFSEKFGKLMSQRYEMSMMSELKFFLGLQIKQSREGTFISQTKYTKDLIRKFNMQ